MRLIKHSIKWMIPQGTWRYRLIWPLLITLHTWIRSKAFRIGLVGFGNNDLLRINTNRFQQQLDEWDEYVNTLDVRECYQKVSLVTILYNRSKEISFFLNAITSQTFLGIIELIVVDDLSPDDSVIKLQNWFDKSASDNNRIELKVIRNSENLGNCHSRNIGVMNATGEIVIIIDSDCLMNKDFIRNHTLAHAINDCTIVIGPHNLETEGLPPDKVLKAYENDLIRANDICNLQNSSSVASFLNCVTRNISIKRSSIPVPLFDPDFSYSIDPESGFGWEDVEMGYRLYKAGARVKYIPTAFTVHISHLSSMTEFIKAQRSLKNFKKLFEKHSELMHVARYWSATTYMDILQWGGTSIVESNSDKQYLENHFDKKKPYPFFIGKSRRLRILSYRWHCPHQYELYKLPHHFTLAVGIGVGLPNKWEYEQRPFPINAEFKHIKDIDPNDYDLAILHFDENVLAFQNTNGVSGSSWGQSFRWFCENIQLPKVAICHGTPQFHGQFTQKYIPHDQIKTIEESRKQLVDYVDDMLIICNSHQAKREWGFRNSKVIWHGFDPAEFPPALYEKGILTLGKSMSERPHYRGYFLYQDVFKNVVGEYLPQGHSVPKPDAYSNMNTNMYAWSKFRNYVDSIRAYSVYFNPTWRSPMPRARGEAMMCGLVPVSANNHDVDMFVKNGVNGFYSNDGDELREYMLFLLKNRNACRKIGHEARMTAMDVFNHDRYLWEWQQTIHQVTGEKHA